ncbi:MAG: hypothetical protein Q3980_17075 [Turicibacter sp.]|nr:hypothetical protein [Turicibacter sp.]
MKVSIIFFYVHPNSLAEKEIDRIVEIQEYCHHYIIADHMSDQKSVALKEGLEMFFEKKWCDISNFEWVIYLLESDSYVLLQRLLKDKVIYDYPDYMIYPVMGAFTQYLILTYGLEKYLNLYCMKEQPLNKCFKDVYDCSMKMIETEFLNYIRLFRLDYVIRERIIEQLY